MTELKKCPFCNGEAKEVDDALSARFDYPKAVKCINCGASHMTAIQWNKRPETGNKWRDFANLHNMTPKEFESEVITTAQAVMAISLEREGSSEMSVIAGQHDGVYELTFKRIIK